MLSKALPADNFSRQSAQEAIIMADESSRSAWDHIRLWLAAVGIPIVLALASFWQFYLKEIWWPVTAINLTTEVTVKEAGLSAASVPEARNLEAIELVIAARNPSSSNVYLCANFWEAWGITIGGPKPNSEDSKDWPEGVSDLLDERSALATGRHYTNNQRTLVSAGTAFFDSRLHANEKISATYVFHIPRGLYDVVEVFVYLPATSRENPARPDEPALGVHYVLDADRSTFSIASVYRIRPDDTHEPVSVDAQGNLPQSDIKYYGWQISGSRVELSLWQSGPKLPPPSNTETPQTSSRSQ